MSDSRADSVPNHRCPVCGGSVERTNATYFCHDCDQPVGKSTDEFENFMLEVELEDEFREFYEGEGTSGDDRGGPRISAQQFKVPNVRRVLPRGYAPDRWLDLGCGGGWVLEALLREWNPRFVAGLDISATRLGEAHRRVPQAEFYRATVESVPLPDNSLDLVTALDVIEHIPSPGALLGECHRLASDLVIKFPIEDTLFDRLQKEHWWPFKRRVRSWMGSESPSDPFEPHLHRFHFDGARQLVRERGFVIVDEYISENPWEDNHATLYPPAYNITVETPLLKKIDFYTKRFILLTMMRTTHLISEGLYYRVFNSGLYLHCRRKTDDDA